MICSSVPGSSEASLGTMCSQPPSSNGSRIVETLQMTLSSVTCEHSFKELLPTLQTLTPPTHPSASALLERVEGNTQYTELQDILLFHMHRMTERTTPYVLAAMSEIDVAFSPLPDYSMPSLRAAFRDLASGY